MNAIRRFLGLAVVVGSIFAANGCYHIKTGGSDGGGGIPSGPTSSGAPTATPSGACGSYDGSSFVVDVTPEILPTNNPTYGYLGEYGLSATGSSLPTAAPIDLAVGSTVQFLNVDSVHVVSAVGMGTKGFPPVPYTFPSGTQNPIGTAIGSALWSTGRLSVNLSFGCYSQTFTLPSVTGNSTVTAYFGDYDNYNSSNGTARGVIVVSVAGQRTPHQTFYYRRQ